MRRALLPKENETQTKTKKLETAIQRTHGHSELPRGPLSLRFGRILGFSRPASKGSLDLCMPLRDYYWE